MVFRAGAATASFQLTGRDCCFPDLPLFAVSCRMKIRRRRTSELFPTGRERKQDGNAFFLYMKKIYLHDVPPQADDLKKEMVDDCEVRGAA